MAESKAKQKSLAEGLFAVVGRVGETRIQVGVDLEGRDIIRLVWPSGEIGLMALANLLGGRGEDVTMMGGQRWTTVDVVYSPEVDNRIVELVDALAAVRVEVGRYVQLELELDGGAELEELELTLQGS